MSNRPNRDIERVYSVNEFVAKLRRLADALESKQAYEMQIAGERLYIPANASFSIEHERSDDLDEVEFQLRWQH
jgi:amphi-Trp domain-containing protein